MNSGATSCFPSVSQGSQIYPMNENGVPSTLEASSILDIHSNSLLYGLSLLKEKVHQVESLVSILISSDQSQPESNSIAIASMGTLVQEIIVTASSMMFTCQQTPTGARSSNNSAHDHMHQPCNKAQESALSQPNLGGNNRAQSYFSGDAFDWYGVDYNVHYNNHNKGIHVSSNDNKVGRRELPHKSKNIGEGLQGKSTKCDIIELDAADLLAKYTHFCEVCGKGFKRDANLRMHMRAHGDEYKTSAALSNPMKKNSIAMIEKDSQAKFPRKYSCPHEGCRWNQKHAKFQPLKSMICVKNHYKRSHCPKMYVCKRCNRKQFSVLSDLRTHEKHCGDLKWLCSCGTTFSRKDKLMGHVALFVGHTPAISPVMKGGKVENIQTMEMQMDGR